MSDAEPLDFNVWRNGYAYAGSDVSATGWVISPDPNAIVLSMCDSGGRLIRLVFYPEMCDQIAALTGYGVLNTGKLYIGVTVWYIDHPAVVFRVVDPRRS